MMIDTDVFLVVERVRRGYGLAVRLTKKKPKLVHGQVSVRLTLEFPSEYFELPTLSAKISAKDGDTQRIAFAQGTLDKVGAVLSAETGLKVEITVNDAKPEARK